MFYTAYNLTIDSELPLPELATVDSHSHADVSIRVSKVPLRATSEATQLGPYLWWGSAGLYLHVPRVARFLIVSGDTILVDAEAGVDEDSVRVFLLGSAIGALLHQRGLLVLHGNAIRMGNGCMVCIGQSGAGKSTLAAGFALRGHEILADDVVAVDGASRVLPGYPRIKLWQDAADHLTIDTGPLHRIRPALQKFHFPVRPASADSLPIRWIYLLDSDEGDCLRFESIHGLDRFRPLHDNTYRLRFLSGVEMKSDHLRLCGKVVNSVHLVRITRPRNGFSLDQMIEQILHDIEEHP